MDRIALVKANEEMSKEKFHDLSVLLLTFERHENLLEILNTCKAAGINKIYVSQDGPRQFPNDFQKKSHKHVRDIIETFSRQNSEYIYFLPRKINRGCAANVVSSCDWVFSKENRLLVIEDDCLPSYDFFEFCDASILQMERSDVAWLACGTQFIQSESNQDSWILSDYPLIWGWATTKKNWKEISESLKNGLISVTRNPKLKEPDKSYWRAGARRASYGFTDVWDTLLVYKMLMANKKAILPIENLVQNVGTDLHATHTKNDLGGKPMNLGVFASPLSTPKLSNFHNARLRKDFYKIKPRHLLSTKITLVSDILRSGLSRKENFASRIILANSDWE